MSGVLMNFNRNSPIDEIAQQINLLTIDEARLVLATKGLGVAEAEEALVKAGLIATTEKINETKAREALVTAGLTKEKQDEILTDLLLYDSTTKQAIATATCTEERLRYALTTAGITGANQEAAISSILLTNANKKQAISYDLVTMKAKQAFAALAANPVTWVVAAVGAYVALGYAIDSVVDSVKEIDDRINENKEQLDEYKDKIVELKEKLEELQKVNAFELTGAEYQSLQRTKQEISEQIELYELLKQAKEKAIDEDTAKITAGNTYEVTPMEMLKQLKQGDIKGAYETSMKSNKNLLKNPLFWLAPQAGALFQLLPQESDNLLEQLDTEYEKYEKLLDKEQLRDNILKDDPTISNLTKLNNIRGDKTKQLAEMSEILEQIISSRDELANKNDGNDYSGVLSQIDQYIDKYQDIIKRELEFTTTAEEKESFSIPEDQRLSLIKFDEKVKEVTTSYEAFNTAISEQNEKGTISNNTLAELYEKYGDISDAVEMTTNGIVLHSDKLAVMNDEKKKSIELGFTEMEKQLQYQLDTNSRELEYYNSLLNSNNNLTSINGRSIQEVITEKQADVDATRNQIAELQAIQYEYNNVISKHNAFMQALQSKDSGAMYDDIVGALDDVQKTWDNGDFGKDEIRNFVDYMTYGDMSTASIEEIKNAWPEAMKAARQYFTETIDGQQHFLDLLNKTEIDGKQLATVDGNGHWTIDIENIDEAAKECGFSVDFLQDNLNKLKDKGFNIHFKTDDNIQDLNSDLANIDERIKNIREQFSRGAGSSKLKQELESLEATRLKVDVEINKEKAIQEIRQLQEQINSANPGEQANLKQRQSEIAAANNIDLQSVLNMDTTAANENVDALTQKVEDLDLGTTIKVDANTEQANKDIHKILDTKYVAKIQLEVEGTTLKDKIKNVIINAVNRSTDDKEEGESKAFGNIKGSAGATGQIDNKKSQNNVMVSEVEPEMVVDPHKGEYTIYNQPTMLDKLPKDAIVFNGKQTKDIVKNGYTNVFGKSYAKGTKAYGDGELKGGKSSNTNNSGNGNSSDSADKKTKQVIDWIEKRITYFSRKVDKWTERAEKTTTNVVDKIYNLIKKNTLSLMDTYAKGYKKYMSYADKSTKFTSSDKYLGQTMSDEKWQKLIREGKIDITKVSEKTADKIANYEQWYQKATSAIDAFEESAEKLYHLPLDKAAHKIDKFNDSIEVLGATLDNISVDKYKDANKNLSKQLSINSKINNENLTALKDANKNVKSASKEVLKNSKSSKVKNAVSNGQEIDLSLFKEGSKEYNAAVKYNKALNAQYEANQKSLLSEQELIKQTRETAKTQFDNIETYYKDRLELIKAEQSALSDEMDFIETRGMVVNKNYYSDQIEFENKKIEKLKASKTELEEQLKKIPEGTSEWYDAKQDLESVYSELRNCNKTIAEMNNNITSIADTIHEKIRTNIADIFSTMDTISATWEKWEQISEETAGYASAGLATMGKYATSLKTSTANQKRDQKVLNELLSAYNKTAKDASKIVVGDRVFNSVAQLYDEIQKYQGLVDEDLKNITSAENNLIDMVIQKYQAELAVVKKTTEAKKEALSAEKSLRDYQKSIKESTDNVASIQKQIAALRGDSSEEGMARIQKLQAQLKDAEEGLADKEYEHTISEQQKMLDTMYTELETLINAETKKRDDLLDTGLNIVNSNLKEITDTVNNYISKYNYTDAVGNIEDSLKSIDGIIQSAEKQISEYISKHSDNATTEGNNDTKSSVTPTTTAASATTSSGSKNTEMDNLAYYDQMKARIEDIFANDKYYTKGKKSSADDYKTEINKYLFGKSGKVLTNAGLKELRKVFGLKNNDDLIDALNEVKYLFGNIRNVKGFASGGVGRLEKPTAEDGLAWVRNGEGFVSPENVQDIKNLLNVLPDVNRMLQPVTLPPTINNNGNRNVEMNITLPNVTNYDQFEQQLVSRMSNSKNYENFIQNMTINRINGTANRTTKNSFSGF